MVFGIMLLVVALLGIWLSVRSRKWKVLLSATGSNAEHVEAMYSYIKSNKIKCKLVRDVGPVGGTSFMNATDVMPNPSGIVVKLKVHQKHMESAKKLLENYQEAL